jgi:DNA-binding CsgD family transcriptional regulator
MIRWVRLSTQRASTRRCQSRPVRLRGFSDSREDRMNLHKNARLTPRGRERIVRQVESGQTPEAVAKAAGVCPRTVLILGRSGA